ncbi:MAG: hypothetical protein AAB336_10135 [Acidobacteriota bacterium]
MLFYFTDYKYFFIEASIGIIVVLVILISPILVFYNVFSDSNKRRKNYEDFRELSKWLALVCPPLLVILLFLGSLGVFDKESLLLFLCILLLPALTLIFGIIALPRWQGFLAVMCYIGYFLYLFTL